MDDDCGGRGDAQLDIGGKRRGNQDAVDKIVKSVANQNHGGGALPFFAVAMVMVAMSMMMAAVICVTIVRSITAGFTMTVPPQRSLLKHEKQQQAAQQRGQHALRVRAAGQCFR